MGCTLGRSARRCLRVRLGGGGGSLGRVFWSVETLEKVREGEGKGERLGGRRMWMRRRGSGCGWRVWLRCTVSCERRARMSVLLERPLFLLDGAILETGTVFFSLPTDAVLLGNEIGSERGGGLPTWTCGVLISSAAWCPLRLPSWRRAFSSVDGNDLCLLERMCSFSEIFFRGLCVFAALEAVDFDSSFSSHRPSRGGGDAYVASHSVRHRRSSVSSSYPSPFHHSIHPPSCAPVSSPHPESSSVALATQLLPFLSTSHCVSLRLGQDSSRNECWVSELCLWFVWEEVRKGLRRRSARRFCGHRR
jgi:hypothetical protein